MANVRLLKFDPNYGYAEEMSLTADTAYVGKLAAAGIGGVAIDCGGNTIQNLGTPVNATDATTKQYVDQFIQGISLLPSVTVLANSNITLSGLQTIDGVALAVGQRVLATGQTNATNNGVWIVASGNWTRPTSQEDFCTGRVMSGLFTFVEAGTNFASEAWAVVGAGTGTVDNNPSSWSQISGAGDIVAGNGLQKSAVNGNTLSVVLATNSGLQFTGSALDHLLNPAGGLNKVAAGLGVTVNTNNTLAVDANGLRVLGVPGGFTISGTAVDGNVTATNLNMLVDGNASLADSLHNHQNVLQAQATVATHPNGSTALAIGDPVQWGSSGTLQRCDAANLATSQTIGVALAACPANGNVAVLKRGIAAGVLSQATPGSVIYLAVGGGLTSTLATGISQSIVRIGTASSAANLDVFPVYVGQRAGS